MKLVADESVDFTIISVLRINGFEILSIAESFFGESDDRVLEIAVNQKSLLLTEDKDFGELVFRFKKENCGIVLIRLSGIQGEEKGEIVLNAIRDHIEKMKYSFSVIDSKKIRIRNLLL